jgi:hypothetical protein
MPRRTSSDRRSILNSNAGIKVTFVEGSADPLTVKLFDELARSIAKVLPGTAGRHIASPQPLPGLIEPGFFMPGRRGLMALEILIEHHLQHHHRIVRFRTPSAIHSIDVGSIQLVDLPFHDPGMVVFVKLLSDLLPSRILLGKLKVAERGFLSQRWV